MLVSYESLRWLGNIPRGASKLIADYFSSRVGCVINVDQTAAGQLIDLIDSLGWLFNRSAAGGTFGKIDDGGRPRWGNASAKLTFQPN